jgi:hypothetical protein
MAVTAYPRDNDGKRLDTKITNLVAAIAASSATGSTAARLAAELDASQREAVTHYMERGRLIAANILATMT